MTDEEKIDLSIAIREAIIVSCYELKEWIIEKELLAIGFTETELFDNNEGFHYLYDLDLGEEGNLTVDLLIITAWDVWSYYYKFIPNFNSLSLDYYCNSFEKKV